MPLVRDARTLKSKAICSLRIAMTSFNSYDEDGRVTSVLLHLQHAVEMLLKAVLCQRKAKVFDKETGKSMGFEKCLRLCQANHGQRWCRFLRQEHKVDRPMERTIQHEDTQTVYGRVQGQGCA